MLWGFRAAGGVSVGLSSVGLPCGRWRSAGLAAARARAPAPLPGRKQALRRAPRAPRLPLPPGPPARPRRTSPRCSRSLAGTTSRSTSRVGHADASSLLSSWCGGGRRGGVTASPLGPHQDRHRGWVGGWVAARLLLTQIMHSFCAETRRSRVRSSPASRSLGGGERTTRAHQPAHHLPSWRPPARRGRLAPSARRLAACLPLPPPPGARARRARCLPPASTAHGLPAPPSPPTHPHMCATRAQARRAWCLRRAPTCPGWAARPWCPWRSTTSSPPASASRCAAIRAPLVVVLALGHAFFAASFGLKVSRAARAGASVHCFGLGREGGGRGLPRRPEGAVRVPCRVPLAAASPRRCPAAAGRRREERALSAAGSGLEGRCWPASSGAPQRWAAPPLGAGSGAQRRRASAAAAAVRGARLGLPGLGDPAATQPCPRTTAQPVRWSPSRARRR